MRERAEQTWGESAFEADLEVAEELNEYGEPALGPTPGRRTRAHEDARVNKQRWSLARARASAGTALPTPHRRPLEAALGEPLGRVTLHSGPASDEAARAVDARAFTIGHQIHLAAGTSLDGAAGRRLLAHEVAHTVQQRGAADGGAWRVSSPGDAHEVEADRFAHSFLWGGALARGAGRAAPLGRVAAGTVSRAMVMRYSEAELTAAEGALAGDHEVAGTREEPLAVVRKSWLTGLGVTPPAEGDGITIDAASCFVVVHTLAAALHDQFYTHVPAERIEERLALRITSAQWQHDAIALQPSSDLVEMLILLDTDGQAVMLSRREGAIVVWVETDRAYAAALVSLDERHSIAEQAVVLIEREVGASMLAAPRRTILESYLNLLPFQRSGPFSFPPVPTETIYSSFGEEIADDYTRRTTTVSSDDTIVDTDAGPRAIPGSTTPEDRREAISMLRQIFGHATPRHTPSEEPATPLTQLEIDALCNLHDEPEDRRNRIIIALRNMGTGTAPQADLNLASVLASATAEVDRSEAAERVGVHLSDLHGPIDLGDSSTTPTAASPVQGEILQGFELNTGMAGAFRFRVANRRATTEVVGHITAQWGAVKVSPSGEVIRQVDTSTAHEYIDDASEEGWIYAPTFDAAGLYEVHAFINHSLYMPAHFFIRVEVIDQEERLRRLERSGAGAFGTEESSRMHGFDVTTTDPFDHLGSISEGELRADLAGDGWLTGMRESERLAAEMERLRALRDSYHEGDDMYGFITERIGRLQAMQTRVDLLGDGIDPEGAAEGSMPVEVQGFFASRSSGITANRDLHLLVAFTNRGTAAAPEFHGDLWDNTELVAGDPPHVTAQGATFDAMMEALFNALCSVYPDGSVSFAYQCWADGAFTDRYRRFTRVTDSLRTDVSETVFNPNVAMAIDIATTLSVLFPPLAVGLVPLSFAYHVAMTADQFETQMRSGTFRWQRASVDVGLLLLDLVPTVGAEARSVTVAGRSARIMQLSSAALAVAEHLGNAWVLWDDWNRQVQVLRDGQITQLAELHARVIDLRERNAADPDLPGLETQLRDLTTEVRLAAEDVFIELAGQQLITVVTSEIAHGLAERHAAGTGEAEGTTRAPTAEGEGEGEASALGTGRRTTFSEMSPDDRAVIAGHLGVGVDDLVIEEGLGSSMVVEFDAVDTNHIVVSVVRIGSRATVSDVLRHQRVVDTARRYNGPLGRLGRIWDDLRVAFGSTEVNPFHVGEEGHDSWEEIPKLEDLVRDRREWLRERMSDERRAEIENDIEVMESEIARHREVVDDMLERGLGRTGVGGAIAGTTDATDDAVAAGLPRPSAFGLINADYYYAVDGDHPLGYALRRRNTATARGRSPSPVCVVFDEAGRLVIRNREPTPTEWSHLLVFSFGAGGSEAFDALRAAHPDANVQPLQHVAVTGRTFGEIDSDAVGRVTYAVYQALLRRGVTDPQATTDACSAGRAFSEHVITVIRGTGLMREFPYRSRHRDRTGRTAEGELHHIIPLYAGGSHEFLVDVDDDLHDELHNIIDEIDFDDDTSMAPDELQGADLDFASGAAVMLPGGEVEIYQLQDGHFVRVGGRRSGG